MEKRTIIIGGTFILAGLSLMFQRIYHAGCQRGVNVVEQCLKNGDPALYEKVDALFKTL